MDLRGEVIVGAFLFATRMTPMIVAATRAKLLRTWIVVLALKAMRTADVDPAIEACVPMLTWLEAIFNGALELGFCCARIKIRFFDRSLFFQVGYSVWLTLLLRLHRLRSFLALNGAITV